MAASFYVVVTGGSTDLTFAVTNFFVDPAASSVAPTTTLVQSPFTSGGCVVDCSNDLGNQGIDSTAQAAVGNYGGGSVAIYDLTNLASQTPLYQFDTGLGNFTGIGTIAMNGTNLVVGEVNGPNIVFVDISQPQSPALYTFANPYGNAIANSIYSIALSGSTVVAAGLESSGQGDIVAIDFSTPSQPQLLYGIPYVGENQFGGQTPWTGPIAVAFDGTTIAAGDASRNVYTFSQGNPSGQCATGLGANVTSVAVIENSSASQIAAGGIETASIALIDFNAYPASAQLEQIPNTPGPNPGGGAVKFFGSSYLAANSAGGGSVALFDTSTWPNYTLIGSASGANLSQTGYASLGITAYNALGGCLNQFLSAPFMLFRRSARPR